MEPASENFELCTEMLKEADPENLYLPALAGYPYMMTPDQIAEHRSFEPGCEEAPHEEADDRDASREPMARAEARAFETLAQRLRITQQ